MLRTAMAVVSALAATQIALADDDVVRLPGHGELKDPREIAKLRSERLIPGGGLLLSFDADDDGRITPAELETGADAAFAAANTDGSLYISLLEQRAWAEELPTRDPVLSSPVYFDTDLSRSVSLEEFTGRIQRLADEVREDGSEDVLVENLTTDAPIKPDADGIERPSSPPTPPIRRRRAS